MGNESQFWIALYIVGIIATYCAGVLMVEPKRTEAKILIGIAALLWPIGLILLFIGG